MHLFAFQFVRTLFEPHLSFHLIIYISIFVLLEFNMRFCFYTYEAGSKLIILNSFHSVCDEIETDRIKRFALLLQKGLSLINQ